MPEKALRVLGVLEARRRGIFAIPSCASYTTSDQPVFFLGELSTATCAADQYVMTNTLWFS
jgi:hypothetical protein